MTNNDSGSTENSFSETLHGLDQEDINNLIEAGTKVANNIYGGGSKVGLIYGKVQSGKTNTVIISIAKANDKGFRFFVVLTSDNVSLYSQTLDRVRNGLPTLLVLGNDDFKEFDDILGRARTAMKKKGVVIVSSKNANNLKKLQEFLRDLDVSNARAVVFDDEADYGSLNSRINREERNEQSRIHSLIESLKRMFGETKFIQVTATPQAVFLQRQGGGFRPEFIVQVKPGREYVGGEKLFDMDSGQVVQSVQRQVDESEIEKITKKEDYRQSGLSAIPDGIKSAISTFLVAASLKIASGRKENFAMLCHISSKVSAHKSLQSLVNRYIQFVSENLDEENEPSYREINRDIETAYMDLSSTFAGHVEISTVKSIIKENIYSTNVQIIISGANRRDPSYTAPYNILVGGDRLGRGLTIKNLIVTYYGRLSGAPKVDTMIQHSRMFGYREKDLDVMRVFSTEEIFRIYHDVYLSDKEEWEYYSKVNTDRIDLPVILSLTQDRRVRATRNQVVPMENVLKYFPGEAYIMKDATKENTKQIDDRLAQFKDEDDYPVQVTFELLKDLVRMTKSSNIEQRWNSEAITKALQSMESYSGDSEPADRLVPYLVVRRGRNEMKGYRSILSSNDNRIRVSNGPILFMYRLETVGNGWEEGEGPLWVPVLRMPTGKAYYFSVGYVVPAEENSIQDV